MTIFSRSIFPVFGEMVQGRRASGAVRISEFESIETALTLAGKVDWVWVDCFTHFPLLKKMLKS